MTYTLSIIIPVYNEAVYLKRCLENIVNTQIEGWQKQIIIVNDGSTDNTKDILDQIKKDNSGIIILSNLKNQGKGATVKKGIGYATGEILIIQDADLEYDSNDYQVIIDEFAQKKINVVYGSRVLGAKIYHHYNANTLFLLGGMLLTKIVNLFFNAKLTDQPTCYKAWRGSLSPKLLNYCQSKGFEFEVEMTAFFLRENTIAEVPIHYYPRSVSHGKKIGIIDFVKSVLVVFWCKFKRGNFSR